MSTNAYVKIASMNQPTLPIVDAKAFMTVAAAADLLGLSDAQVRRLVDQDKLTGHCPITSSRVRAPLLLDTAEVRRYAAARNVVAGRA